MIFSKSKNELLKVFNEHDKSILIDMLYFYMDKLGVEKALIIISNILKNIDYKIMIDELESILEIPEIDEYISHLNKSEITNTLILDLYTLYQHNNENGLSNESALTLRNIVARYRLLSKEETRNLFLEYKLNGSKEAKEKLVNHNLRMVLNVAKYKSYKCKTSLEDLFQTGCEYLIKAIELFDIEKDYSFSTYAYKALRRGMAKYVSMDTPIKMSDGALLKADLIKKTEDELFVKLKRTPTIKEIAKFTNLAVDEIKLIKRSTSPVTSLTEPVNEEELVLVNIVKDEHDYIGELEDKVSDEMVFEKISWILDDRELIIVTYNLGLFQNKMSLKELASHFNLSKEGIRLILKKALKNIEVCLYSRYQHYKPRDIKNEFTIRYLLLNCNDDVLTRAIGLLDSKYQTILVNRYSMDLKHIKDKSFLTWNEFMMIYNEIIPLLNEKIQELNVQEQGDNKKNLEIAELFNFYESQKVYEAINLFLTPQEISSNDISGEKIGKIKKYLLNNDNRTLKDFFPEYNSDILRMIIEGPTTIDKYLIIKRYGNDYINNPKRENLLSEIDNNKFLKIIKKMEEILKYKLDIYLFFNEYSKYEVDSLLANLSYNEKDILRLVFGSDYKQFKGVDLATFEKVLKVISDIKNYANKNRVRPYINLESLYPRATKELLYETVNSLKSKDKDILIYYFGENLNKGLDIDDVNLQEILNNINKLILEKIGIMTIYDYTECANKEMIELVMNNLYIDDKLIIEKYLGKYYYTVFKNNVVDTFTYNRFLKIIRELKYYIRLKRGKNPPKLSIQEMLKTSLNLRIAVRALNTYLDYENALYLSLFLGYYKNHKYTFKELSNLFNKEQDEIASLINLSLEQIKNKNVNLEELVLIKQK